MEGSTRDAVLYSAHARHEMLTEALGVIADHEVAEAVASAGLVEEYPDDRPYPSCTRSGGPDEAYTADDQGTHRS